MTRRDIFHPDVEAPPWRWEARTPNTAVSQDSPDKTQVAIVGASCGGPERGVFSIGAGVPTLLTERDARCGGCRERDNG